MKFKRAIDDDVLAAARGLAARQHKNVGEVIAALARQALRRDLDLASAPTRNGVPLLPRSADARPVTLEILNQLRDAQP